jgi:hypothetical protein
MLNLALIPSVTCRFSRASCPPRKSPLTPSNSNTSALSHLHLLSFGIHPQIPGDSTHRSPVNSLATFRLTPFFPLTQAIPATPLLPLHTQKRRGTGYHESRVTGHESRTPGPVGAPTFRSLRFPISIFNFPFSQCPVCSSSPFRVHWNYRFP